MLAILMAMMRLMGGGPDVLFLNTARRHLYAAVGGPGVIDVFDLDALERTQTAATKKGAHTPAFDAARNKVSLAGHL